LDAVPQAVARLDNSAAKHKLSVKPKKQRMSRKHKRLTKVLEHWSKNMRREVAFEAGYKTAATECARSSYGQRTVLGCG